MGVSRITPSEEAKQGKKTSELEVELNEVKLEDVDCEEIAQRLNCAATNILCCGTVWRWKKAGTEFLLFRTSFTTKKYRLFVDGIDVNTGEEIGFLLNLQMRLIVLVVGAISIFISLGAGMFFLSFAQVARMPLVLACIPVTILVGYGVLWLVVGLRAFPRFSRESHVEKQAVYRQIGRVIRV